MAFEFQYLSPQYIQAFGQTHAQAGQRQARQAQQQLDRDAEFRQQELDLKRQQQESFERRDFAEMQNVIDLQRVRNQGALDQIAMQNQLEQQRQQRNQQISAASEQQLRQKLASGEFAYTPQQRQEYARIYDSIQRLQNDPSFTPEQKEQVIQALKLKALGIRQDPMPVLKQPSKYPKGQDIGEVWYTSSGVPVTRDKDGQVKKLADGFDFMGAWEKSIDANTTDVLDSEGYSTGQTKVDKKAALRDVVDQFKLFMAIQQAQGDPEKLEAALQTMLQEEGGKGPQKSAKEQVMEIFERAQAQQQAQQAAQEPLPIPPGTAPAGGSGPMQGPPMQGTGLRPVERFFESGPQQQRQQSAQARPQWAGGAFGSQNYKPIPPEPKRPTRQSIPNGEIRRIKTPDGRAIVARWDARKQKWIEVRELK